ncbi:MAG: protein jag [Actinomycetes bacterium]
MTRRTTTEADSLVGAIAAALAEIADCDVEKVRVDLDVPGLDPTAVGARLTLELRDAASRDRGRPRVDGGEDDHDDREEEAPLTQEDLDAEADAAADFVEGLLDVLDLPGDLKLRVFEDYVEVEVVDVGSGVLIGRRGQTLEAIQELLRCALQRQFQRRTGVKVDVEGYRVRRLEKIQEKAEEAIDEVLDTGEAVRLEPMDVFERKAVHGIVAKVDGVTSRSQGREPGRRVVIEPSDD